MKYVKHWFWRFRVRDDYRVHDMSRMRQWGYNAFWLEPGRRVCMFTPFAPRPGDVVVASKLTVPPAKAAFVLVAVDSMENPGDQFFAHVRPIGSPDRLPKSTYESLGYIA